MGMPLTSAMHVPDFDKYLRERAKELGVSVNELRGPSASAAAPYRSARPATSFRAQDDGMETLAVGALFGSLF